MLLRLALRSRLGRLLVLVDPTGILLGAFWVVRVAVGGVLMPNVCGGEEGGKR